MTTDQPTPPPITDSEVEHLARAEVALVGDDWDDPALTPDTPRSRAEEFRESFRLRARNMLAVAYPLIVGKLEAAGWQPQDDEVLAEEFRKGFEAGEVNAALLHHAETERLRAVADAAARWRAQFSKPADSKFPRMAALFEAVDKLTEGSA